ASGARPAFAFGVAPPDGDIEAQMERHQWGAARLWEGVIGPSDDAWLAGARVVAAQDIDLGTTTRGKPNADVAAHAEALRTLASEATRTDEPAARSELYGTMLHTCASCHAIVRPGAVAGR